MMIDDPPKRIQPKECCGIKPNVWFNPHTLEWEVECPVCDKIAINETREKVVLDWNRCD